MKAWKKLGLASLVTLMGNVGVTVFAEDYASSYQAWDAAGIAKIVLICASLAVVALFAYYIYKGVKNKVFATKKSKIFTSLLALLGIVVIGANYAVNMFVNVIDTYFAPSYADETKIAEAEEEITDDKSEISARFAPKTIFILLCSNKLIHYYASGSITCELEPSAAIVDVTGSPSLVTPLIIVMPIGCAVTSSRPLTSIRTRSGSMFK